MTMKFKRIITRIMTGKQQHLSCYCFSPMLTLMFLLLIPPQTVISTTSNSNKVKFATSPEHSHERLAPDQTTSNTRHHHHNNNNNNNNNNHQDNSDQSQDSLLDSSSSVTFDQSPTGGGQADGSSLYQPPHELSVIKINDTSVVLKWDIPFGSHQHLQFFKIQYKSTRKGVEWKTDNREISPTTRAHQINGLKPGNYFFIVNAVYDNDDNVPSARYKYQLKARSKIPASDMPEQTAPKIFWHEAESDFIRFKWTWNFKEKDMEWYGYLVYYRSAHQVVDFTIYNTLDENVELVDLEPDTPYEAKVVGYNQVAVSEFSDIIRIKTKPKSNSTTASNSSTSSSSSPSDSKISTPITTTQLPPTKRPLTSTTPVMIDTNPVDEQGQKLHPSTLIEPPSNVISKLSKPSSGPTITAHHEPNPSAKVPVVSVGTPDPSPPVNGTINQTAYHSFANMIEFIVAGKTVTTMALKYSLFVLIPILLSGSVSLCLFNCRRNRKKSPPSSTNQSMQFDLEINAYFKNSFPGVEKEHPSMANHHAHHGFVNNHPHINDLA